MVLDGCVKRNAELLQISQPSKSKHNNSGSHFNIGPSNLYTLLHSREHRLNTFLRKSRRKAANYLEIFAPIYKVFWVLIDGLKQKEITVRKPGFRGDQYVWPSRPIHRLVNRDWKVNMLSQMAVSTRRNVMLLLFFDHFRVYELPFCTQYLFTFSDVYVFYRRPVHYTCLFSYLKRDTE